MAAMQLTPSPFSSVSVVTHHINTPGEVAAATAALDADLQELSELKAKKREGEERFKDDPKMLEIWKMKCDDQISTVQQRMADRESKYSP